MKSKLDMSFGGFQEQTGLQMRESRKEYRVFNSKDDQWHEKAGLVNMQSMCKEEHNLPSTPRVCTFRTLITKNMEEADKLWRIWREEISKEMREKDFKNTNS